MAGNLTSGVIQVLDNDVQSINNALMRILNLIDTLRGLRGITDLYDQATVSRPQQSNAAVRFDNLSELTADIADAFLAMQRPGSLSPEALALIIEDAAHPLALAAPLPGAMMLSAPATAYNLYGGVETMDIAALILGLKDTGVMT